MAAPDNASLDNMGEIRSREYLTNVNFTNMSPRGALDLSQKAFRFYGYLVDTSRPAMVEKTGDPIKPETLPNTYSSLGSGRCYSHRAYQGFHSFQQCLAL